MTGIFEAPRALPDSLFRLRPSFPGPLIGYSLYLASQGRLSDAIRESVRAEQLDPVSPSTVVTDGLAPLLQPRLRRRNRAGAKNPRLEPRLYLRLCTAGPAAVLAKGLRVEDECEMRWNETRWIRRSLWDSSPTSDALRGDARVQAGISRGVGGPRGRRTGLGVYSSRRSRRRSVSTSRRSRRWRPRIRGARVR